MMCPKCECPLFLDRVKDNGWHGFDHYKCPQCKSHNRHRLLYLLLKDRDNGNMIEYSPVKILKDTFNHFSADFPPRENQETGVVMADVLDDLTQSQFKDNEFDTVICSSVLDAIKDDKKAIKELHRITKDKAFVSVPIFEIEKTIDFDSLLNGNYNHYHRPAIDYVERLSIFKKIDIIKGSDYQDSNKYGLEGEYIFICQK
jgi:hypothetical protein